MCKIYLNKAVKNILIIIVVNITWVLTVCKELC